MSTSEQRGMQFHENHDRNPINNRRPIGDFSRWYYSNPNKWKELQQIYPNRQLQLFDLSTSQSLSEKTNFSKVANNKAKQEFINFIKERGHEERLNAACSSVKGKMLEETLEKISALQEITQSCFEDIQGHSPYDTLYKTALKSFESAAKELGQEKEPENEGEKAALQKLTDTFADLSKALKGKFLPEMSIPQTASHGIPNDKLKSHQRFPEQSRLTLVEYPFQEEMRQAYSRLYLDGLQLEKRKHKIDKRHIELTDVYQELVMNSKVLEDKKEANNNLREQITESIKELTEEQETIRKLTENREQYIGEVIFRRLSNADAELNKFYTLQFNAIQEQYVLEEQQQQQDMQDVIYNDAVDKLKISHRDLKNDVNLFSSECELFYTNFVPLGIPGTLNCYLQLNTLNRRLYDNKFSEQSKADTEENSTDDAYKQQTDKLCSTTEDLNNLWTSWTEVKENQLTFRQKQQLALYTAKESIYNKKFEQEMLTIVEDRLVENGIDRQFAQDFINKWDGFTCKNEFNMENKNKENRRYLNLHNLTQAAFMAFDAQFFFEQETSDTSKQMYARKFRDAIDSFKTFGEQALDINKQGQAHNSEYEIPLTTTQQEILQFLDKGKSKEKALSIDDTTTEISNMKSASEIFEEYFSMSNSNIEKAKQLWRDFLKKTDIGPTKTGFINKLKQKFGPTDAGKNLSAEEIRQFYEQFPDEFREARKLKTTWERIGREDPSESSFGRDQYLKALHECRKFGWITGTTFDENSKHKDKEKTKLINQVISLWKKYGTLEGIKEITQEDLEKEINRYKTLSKGNLENNEDVNDLYRYQLCDIAFNIGKNKNDNKAINSLEKNFEDCIAKKYLFRIEREKTI